MTVIDMRLRRFFFACRWLLAPLYVGLVVGLAAVVFKAVEKILTLVLNVAGLSEASTIVAVLGSVDLTLVGSLVLLVIISGYENFISPMEEENGRPWPEWMGKLKFNGLALAVMTLIIVISAVSLLEALIEKGQASDHELGRHAAVFFVFVVSTLLLAVSDLLQRRASR